MPSTTQATARSQSQFGLHITTVRWWEQVWRQETHSRSHRYEVAEEGQEPPGLSVIKVHMLSALLLSKRSTTVISTFTGLFGAQAPFRVHSVNQNLCRWGWPLGVFRALQGF